MEKSTKQSAGRYGQRLRPLYFGVSFSLHRCSELGLDKRAVLTAALEDLGVRRFRLMSYWNIHEPERGVYDFKELDWQMDLIASYGGQVSLALGKRQPRWPECHIPDWAVKLPAEEWYQALYAFVAAVVRRYRDHPALASWQLENEALLKSFGHCRDGDYNRRRLRWEMQVVRQLDPSRPVIMTLSDSWGIPIRQPLPDVYALTVYRYITGEDGELKRNKRPPLFYGARAKLIHSLARRPVFIHELQAEPWLNKNIKDVSVSRQLKHMNPTIFLANAGFALKSGLSPADLWGLEWWYWLKHKHKKPGMWEAAKKIFAGSNGTRG